MDINIRIGENRIPEGMLAQVESGLTDSRLPSVASSGGHNDNDDYAGEAWVELDNHFQGEDKNFIEQDELDLTGEPGLLLDTPATPAAERPSTPMSPTVSFRCQPVVPSLVSGSPLSPTVSPLKPPKSPLRPLSTMRPIIPGLKGEDHPHISPPCPHVPLPSQGASASNESASTRLARASPSGRFFACPDLVHDLGLPRKWVPGQVISTLGDAFCHLLRSKPRNERYEVLYTDLFGLWGSSKPRSSISFYFKQIVSPFKCRAWLIPMLLEHHWYLLAFDWIDLAIHIYDSLAMSKIPDQCLVKFGHRLAKLIEEYFGLESHDWNVIPEKVSGCHLGLARF